MALGLGEQATPQWIAPQGGTVHWGYGSEHVKRPLILERYEIGAAHAVLACHLFLAGSGKRVEMCDHLASLETCVGQGHEIACRLQSTRDSADPEFDVVERCLRQLCLDHDVGELHPPTRAHYAMQFGEHRRLVRTEVDDPV